MKTIYTAILSLFLGFSYQAQLTQANHAPANGDIYKTFQCDSLGITPGASGAGAVWNFASLVTHSAIANGYTAATVSDPSYTAATIAVAASTANISYYSSSATNLNYYGGNILIGTISGALFYTSPAVFATYPMGLNTTTTCVTGGSINALSFPGTFTGASGILVDGSGTLTVPGGTYTNALRVVTTQTINFNLGLATGTITQKNYDYYSIGIKAPILTITTSTAVSSVSAASSQTVVTRLDTSIPVFVGIAENKPVTAEVMVFPNPASANLQFSTNSTNSYQVRLYDITGKLVRSELMNEGKLKLDVSDLNSGLYMYSVCDQQMTVKTGKVTVFH